MAKVTLVPPVPQENKYLAELNGKEMDMIYWALRAYKYTNNGMSAKPRDEFDAIEKVEIHFNKHSR